MTDIYATLVRMPREMEGPLKQLAAKNDRSMASMMRILIREAVERELVREAAEHAEGRLELEREPA